MIEYKFSIVFPTYRPGSMELLFTSLSKQTYKNFELILVDDYSPRAGSKESKQELYNKLIENKLVEDGKEKKENEKPKYLKYHDGPKPDCFGKFYKFGTTVNTGIIEAFKSEFGGDIILFLQDYTYLEPRQLEKWNDAFNRLGSLEWPNTIITGCASILSTPLPVRWLDPFSVYSDSVEKSILKVGSEKEFRSLEGFKYIQQWNPWEYEGFYTGIPRNVMMKLNGLDENIDYPCEQANDFFERAKIAGYKLLVNLELNCLMMDHRNWHPPDIGDDWLWHIMRIECLRKGGKGAAPRVVPLEEYKRLLRTGERGIKALNCFDLGLIDSWKDGWR
jgi:glycosyltransferase involved in cell wall biosynthesis